MAEQPQYETGRRARWTVAGLAVGAAAGAICGAAYGAATSDLVFCTGVGLPFGTFVGLLLSMISHPKECRLPHG